MNWLPLVVAVVVFALLVGYTGVASAALSGLFWGFVVWGIQALVRKARAK